MFGIISIGEEVAWETKLVLTRATPRFTLKGRHVHTMVHSVQQGSKNGGVVILFPNS